LSTTSFWHIDAVGGRPPQHFETNPISPWVPALRAAAFVFRDFTDCAAALGRDDKGVRGGPAAAVKAFNRLFA
jgi:hypothetical protein